MTEVENDVEFLLTHASYQAVEEKRRFIKIAKKLLELAIMAGNIPFMNTNIIHDSEYSDKIQLPDDWELEAGTQYKGN